MAYNNRYACMIVVSIENAGPPVFREHVRAEHDIDNVRRLLSKWAQQLYGAETIHWDFVQTGGMWPLEAHERKTGRKIQVV